MGSNDRSPVIVTSVEKEENVSYCQFVAGEYAKEISALTHRLLDPTARQSSELSRARRLQQLLFVNLPNLQRVMKQRGAEISPPVSTMIKKHLPLAHAIVTHYYELTELLSPPQHRKTPVSRQVLKYALCEYCFYPRVLFFEQVPAGELAFGQAACLNGYAGRDRQIEHWCLHCNSDRRPGRRVLQREAVLKRFQCFHCKKLIIAIEAVPIGEPYDAPQDAVKGIESFAGRFRRPIHSQCTCGSDCKINQSSGSLVTPLDIRLWLSPVGQSRQIV